MDLNSLYLGVTFGFVVLAFFVVWHSHFQVDEGHLAVLVRFGKALRKSEGGMESLVFFNSGSHWKFPWDRVTVFSTMERVIDLTGEHGGKSAMAADGTVLSLDSKIRFHPDLENTFGYLFGLKSPMLHIRELFLCLMRNEIANFGGTKIDEKSILGAYSLIRQERQKLNSSMEMSCRKQFGSNYGIQFSGVDLVDIVPPHELEAALNGIQNATKEAETLFSKAEADSRQRVMAAEKGVEIARLRAEAARKELSTVAKFLRAMNADGVYNYYLNHKKTELIGHSKLNFIQSGDARW